MSVRVTWSSAFSRYEMAVDGAVDVVEAQGLTPESIIRAAGFTDADLRSVQAMVNGRPAARTTLLNDGDEVRFEIDIHPG